MLEGVSQGVAGVAESAVRGDGAGIVGGGKRIVDGMLGGGGEALHGLTNGSVRLLRGTVGGVSYFGRGVANGADAVVSGVLDPTVDWTDQAVRGLWEREEVCSTHKVYQRTLLSRLGLRRKRGITVCA